MIGAWFLLKNKFHVAAVMELMLSGRNWSVPEILDPMRAIAHMGGDLDIYQDVAGIFLEDAHRVRGLLEQTVDEYQLLPVLHELANSFGIIGAVRGELMVREFESMLRAAEPVSLRAALQEVTRELQQVCLALADWLAAR